MVHNPNPNPNLQKKTNLPNLEERFIKDRVKNAKQKCIKECGFAANPALPLRKQILTCVLLMQMSYLL